MKNVRTVKLVVVGVFLISAVFLACTQTAPPKVENEAAPSPSPNNTPVAITVSATLPGELNEAGGGAPQASMQQAAAFAWQEFIALNWPAVKQTGGVDAKGAYVKQRDVSDTAAKFGDPTYKGPLTWQTFRGKAEIFPGNTMPTPTPTPGTTPAPGPTPAAPPGYPSVAAGDPSFGYDALPVYNNYASPVTACPGVTPSTDTVWVNLDETDQITLDSMFAGNAPALPPVPAGSPTPTPGSYNSSPQLIRFMAKANRTEYAYVAAQGYYNAATDTGGWWYQLPQTISSNTKKYLATNKTSPPAGSTTEISLPTGTIELKAGWRVLNETEAKSNRFHTTTVQYYENNAAGNPCFRQDTFGLVALHIIQKTPTAPYFIYATFEQADNILTSTGDRVEDEDGFIKTKPPCPPGQTEPCATSPGVMLQDTATVSSSQLPPQVNLVPANAPYCNPGSQIYYINSSNFSAANGGGLPAGGPVCINYRDNLIPQPIIDSNKTAHAAISDYTKAQNMTDSVWLYYKLINVQYVPIDKDYAGELKTNDPNTGQNPASFYQANIVVETNQTLQMFSGSLIGLTGVNSEYASQFAQPAPTPPFSNEIRKQVYYSGKQYNMGGCMACHSAQGQLQSGDFSVILARGGAVNGAPEPPAPQTVTGMTQIKRNRTIASY